MLLGVCCLTSWFVPSGSERALKLNRLCQDLLEHHFGHVRQSAGGTSSVDARTAKVSNSAAGAMRSTTLDASGSRKGNSANAPLAPATDVGPFSKATLLAGRRSASLQHPPIDA